jgi:hypothetical protein
MPDEAVIRPVAEIVDELEIPFVAEIVSLALSVVVDIPLLELSDVVDIPFVKLLFVNFLYLSSATSRVKAVVEEAVVNTEVLNSGRLSVGGL